MEALHPDDPVRWAHEQMEIRQNLYDEYALQHESFEDFCDRCADELGEDWTKKLKR